MKSVQVLLSAYNGEKYIAQQIDSILRQKKVRISLLIRDDGSCDGTMDLLKGYERKHANVFVYTGSRKGASGSFYDLMQKADLSNPYFAFADQDDVWQEDKLVRAVEMLEKSGAAGLPLLYAGKVMYASCDLGRKEAFAYKVDRGASFGNALVENICMGCTEVFNRALIQLAGTHIPSADIMHDWWLYLSASYFGTVVYDPQAYMLYRQHGGNEVGMQNGWGGRWKNRIRHIHQLKHKLSFQAQQFWKTYAQLMDDSTEEICQLCSYRKKIRIKIDLIRNQNIYRQNAIDDIVYRLLFFIGFL